MFTQTIYSLLTVQSSSFVLREIPVSDTCFAFEYSPIGLQLYWKC